VLSQILQVTGALLILAGYGGLQGGKLHAQQVSYLLLNLGGSAILAVLALIQRQWGFLLLEGVWAVVSLLAAVRNAARREPADRTVPTARTGKDRTSGRAVTTLRRVRRPPRRDCHTPRPESRGAPR
jgi:hypothetical protein